MAAAAMAQSLCNLSSSPVGASPRPKSISKLIPCHDPPLLRLRPSSSSFPIINNVRPRTILSMASSSDRKDNLDHLQRTGGAGASGAKPQQLQYSPQSSRRAGQVAPIGLWDRFPTARTVQQMMETMERMMEDPLAFSSSRPAAASSNETGGYVRGRTPWEIKEGEGDYKMRFDMPGMTKDDVKVWVEDNMLVVKAEKLKKDQGKDDDDDDDQRLGEWSVNSYGRYSCRIALPENVEFDKIKAEVRDGVLYLTVPKATTSTAKIFDINVN
ncbi:hypothetical protein Dimus_015197 [Dionaea muscipula]